MNPNLAKLNFLYSKSKNSKISFTENTYIDFAFQDRNEVEQEFNDASIKWERLRNDSIRVSAYEQGFKLFFDAANFEETVKKTDHFQLDIGILNYKENTFLFFDASLNETYSSTGKEKTIFYFTNLFYYLKTLEFLKSKEEESFVDYYNLAYREIIMTSPSKKGKLIIGYQKRAAYLLDPTISIEVRCKKFYSVFESKEFPKFFKNELFDFLGKEPKEDRYNKFLNELDNIYDAASRNYDVYLLDFSFDDLKKEYKSKKDIYFESFRTIAGKIITQVTGLPLSLTVAVYATYKIEDSIVSLIFILVAFIIYTFYLVFILRMYRADLKDINYDFIQAYDNIEKSKYFEKHVDLLLDFEKDRTQIKKRIDRIHLAISYLLAIVIMLNTLFSIFILFQMAISIKWILFSAIVFIILLISLYMINN